MVLASEVRRAFLMAQYSLFSDNRFNGLPFRMRCCLVCVFPSRFSFIEFFFFSFLLQIFSPPRCNKALLKRHLKHNNALWLFKELKMSCHKPFFFFFRICSSFHPRLFLHFFGGGEGEREQGIRGRPFSTRLNECEKTDSLLFS